MLLQCYVTVSYRECNNEEPESAPPPPPPPTGDPDPLPRGVQGGVEDPEDVRDEGGPAGGADVDYMVLRTLTAL